MNILNDVGSLSYLKELRHSLNMNQKEFAILIGNWLASNCDGCINNNTDECMHCMRAYTDCYEAE